MVEENFILASHERPFNIKVLTGLEVAGKGLLS